MKPLFFALTAIALTGCGLEIEKPTAAPSEACPASVYKGDIGKPVSTVVFPLTLEHRIIAPGMPVTMDYLPERLNVHVDEAGVIASLRCG